MAYRLPFDPLDPLGTPTAAATFVRYTALVNSLRERLAAGEAINLGDLDRCEADATELAQRAFVGAAFWGTAGNHLVVSVAGCNTSDLRDALPEIAKAATAFPLVSDRGNVLRRRAHQLNSAGFSVSAIARRRQSSIDGAAMAQGAAG